MPKDIAQLTGIVVCAIITFGADLDVTYAIPLGVCAGALAMFFVSLAEAGGCTKASCHPAGRS